MNIAIAGTPKRVKTQYGNEIYDDDILHLTVEDKK